MTENNIPEPSDFTAVRERAIELSVKILNEVRTANLAVTAEAEKWAKRVAQRIAEREHEVEQARLSGDKFLWKKNKDALERLSFETTELTPIAETIRDKTILEVLKNGGKTVLAFVLKSLLAFG